MRKPVWMNAWLCFVVAAAALGTLSASAPAAAFSFNEFPIPTAASDPIGIALGLDGNLWVAESAGNKIAQINPTTGAVTTEFPLPLNGQGLSSQPHAILRGPDGALWFTMTAASRIGRITTAGALSFFPTPTASSGPEGIAIGPDGNIWFTEISVNRIGRLNPSNGHIDEFVVPTANSRPARITAARDGNLWFTESQTSPPANKIAQITTGGIITLEVPVPTANSEPWSIRGAGGSVIFTERAASQIGVMKLSDHTFTEVPTPTANSDPVGLFPGPDGNFYFSELAGNKIGQINSAGTITEFPVPTANSGPGGLTVGPDGAIWFTEENASQIARFRPLSSPIQLFAAVLPSSRSVQVGGTPATAFATIINAGPGDATACGISEVTFVPGQAHFQTTDPATNQLTGMPDTPVGIQAGKLQTFVVAVTPTAPFPPTQVELGFACSNANAAPINFGLDTILYSASTGPVPDIVALAATAQNDGILHIQGMSGSSAFAVATVNVGASASITATANTGAVGLPLTINLCQTDPMSGMCTSAIGPSVTTPIGANQTPTFGIFATASGAIPFLPATNRIFVQFSDAGGTVHGATSVAVQTQ